MYATLPAMMQHCSLRGGGQRRTISAKIRIDPLKCEAIKLKTHEQALQEEVSAASHREAQSCEPTSSNVHFDL